VRRWSCVWLAVAGRTLGYAIVFLGHFVIERNTPASLTHPVLAALCNARVVALFVCGELQGELARRSSSSST